MKVSYSWLKEYVDIKLTPQKLADRLTMAGMEVTSLYSVGDEVVFEIEITPNRPDCLSVIGIAREIAAITGKKLKIPKIAPEKDSKSTDLDFGLKVIDKKGCPRYIGRTISNVKVGASPAWLKNRLESVGIRPVNNIVDITNYVLLETGQPLHAFDFDRLIDAEIIVRRAKEGEKIITIDGLEKELSSGVLIIADGRRPVAIAGIMGGKDTEVTGNTKNILLESACFDSVLIRRASRQLSLSSESSYRFERSVDKNNISEASLRAVNLINDLAKSKLMHTKDFKTGKSKFKKKNISLNPITVNNLLEEDIAASQMLSILKRLGFSASKKSADSLTVGIPSFREDVIAEADLIEEIARIYGYDNIPLSLPAVKITDIEEQPFGEVSSAVRNMLTAQGFNEVITYSLISEDLSQKINLNTADLTKIANPLSNEQEVLRPTLLIGLLNCMATNFNRNIDNVRIFEFGNIVKDAKEISALGIAISGFEYNDWLRRIHYKTTLFDLKGTIEEILSKLGIAEYKFINKDLPFCKQGNSAILKIENTQIGVIGEISDEIIDKWDIRNKQIFICELNMDKIDSFKKLDKTYAPLINFPSIKRDISLIMNIELSAGEVLNTIKEAGGIYLKNIVLLEQYIGEQIPAGNKGLSFSLEYQAPDRTLKDEEVNSFHSNICETLRDKFKVQIR